MHCPWWDDAFVSSLNYVPTRRQTKRDRLQKTTIFSPTTGARNSISPKLCTLKENVVTIIVECVNHFSIQRIVFFFPARAKMLIFGRYTHWVNLIPAGCHGNLPVNIMLMSHTQWCSPRDQSLGLEAPRGQKNKVLVLVLVLTKKVLRIFMTSMGLTNSWY